MSKSECKKGKMEFKKNKKNKNMTDTENKTKRHPCFTDISYPDFVVGFSKNSRCGEKEDWVIKGDNFRLEYIEEMSFKLQFNRLDGVSLGGGDGYSFHLDTESVDDLLEVFASAAIDGTLKEWRNESYGLNEEIRHIKDTRPEEEQPKLIAEAEAYYEEEYPKL
jgi:hypothetical protein